MATASFPFRTTNVFSYTLKNIPHFRSGTSDCFEFRNGKGKTLPLVTSCSYDCFQNTAERKTTRSDLTFAVRLFAVTERREQLFVFVGWDLHCYRTREKPRILVPVWSRRMASCRFFFTAGPIKLAWFPQYGCERYVLSYDDNTVRLYCDFEDCEEKIMGVIK